MNIYTRRRGNAVRYEYFVLSSAEAAALSRRFIAGICNSNEASASESCLIEKFVRSASASINRSALYSRIRSVTVGRKSNNGRTVVILICTSEDGLARDFPRRGSAFPACIGETAFKKPRCRSALPVCSNRLKRFRERAA